MSQPDQDHHQPTVRRRPGDRVVRRTPLKVESIALEPPKIRRRPQHPALVAVMGFAGVILVGALLLTLPISSTSGETTGFIAALFTATSATCVTGLVVVDTGTYWTPFGQVVILLLIQLGGFGFMTSSTLLLSLIGRRVTLRERLVLGHTMGAEHPGGLLRLVKRVAVATAIIEVTGIAILFLRFQREMPVGRALWWSVFHAVSAFNNAGFDIIGRFQSLIGYQRDPWVLLTIGSLIVLGGIGFVPLADVYKHRSWRRFAVDTKLIFVTTAMLLLGGAVSFGIMEWTNPTTLGGLPWADRVLNSVFNSISPRTAGFASVPLDTMRDSTLFVIIALMFIGGASGSTAGGIKVQTFSVLFFTIVAALRGTEHVVVFNREVPLPQIQRALAVALLAIAIIFSVALGLSMFEPFRFIDVLFETVSGFGTVGLTVGITPTLGTWSRLFLIGIMFTGRLGPLTLALALAARLTRQRVRYAEATVRIG